jgi:hypothetical protein
MAVHILTTTVHAMTSSCGCTITLKTSAHWTQTQPSMSTKSVLLTPSQWYVTQLLAQPFPAVLCCDEAFMSTVTTQLYVGIWASCYVCTLQMVRCVNMDTCLACYAASWYMLAVIEADLKKDRSQRVTHVVADVIAVSREVLKASTVRGAESSHSGAEELTSSTSCDAVSHKAVDACGCDVLGIDPRAQLDPHGDNRGHTKPIRSAYLRGCVGVL